MKSLINLNENISGTVGGSVSTIAASAFGLISSQTIIEAVVVSLIGAVVGYLTSLLIKRIEKAIRGWRDKN